jgi:hypothetical protein
MTTQLFAKSILSKCFSVMKPEIRALLMSLLITVAEQRSYLESKTQHADAIHWHLQKVYFEDIQLYLKDFFDLLLKRLKHFNLRGVTVAFDETYLPYYGKKWSLWIHGYNNKIKGATGSYKFMVCSIVLGEKRFVLYMLPMKRGDEAYEFLENILSHIEKYLNVRLVLCDRGFFSERVVSTLEKNNMKYIILTPRNKKIKRYMKAKELHVTDFLKANYEKSTHYTQVNYIFAYQIFGHDWAFTTNCRINVLALVMTYKGRWGIETIFRVMDFADIKSKSTEIVTRTFLFLVSIVLYNLWLEFKEKKHVTFETFLDYLALVNKSKEQVIKEWQEANAFLDGFSPPIKVIS